MVKLSLIIDDSEIFLDKQAKEIEKDWGYNSSDCKILTQWYRGAASQKTFFNDMYVKLDLTNKEDMKSFVKLINERKKNNLFQDNWFGNGVVIIAKTKQGAKKIIDLVIEFNGKTYIKKDNEENKQLLLNKINLPEYLKSFISDYVGDEYDMIYSIIDSINSMSNEERQSITIDNIVTYLPYKKGSIPPWNFTNSIFDGDINKTLNELDRVIENTHPYVLMSLLKNSVKNMYNYRAATLAGCRTRKEKANYVNLSNPYSFIGPEKVRNDISLEVCEHLVDLMYKAECDMKGDSAVSIRDILTIIVIRLMLSMKYNYSY